MIAPKHTNELIHETSPYLLQHAHNPVNWMPWGEAALNKAKEEMKPILLSIGYSTCHWCHVMEHESFQNEETAQLMNELFVNIKVDREERPDLDLIYMTYAQALNGSGGWPLNVWLTPELTPFYVGTYFPPADKGGRMGFPKLCQEIHKVWEEDRENLVERSRVNLEKLQGYLNDEFKEQQVNVVEVFRKSFDDLANAYDYHEGGFSGAPKFPRTVTLGLLWRLRLWLLNSEESEKNSDADWGMSMAKNTLIKMSHGGIRDLLGGGFHRYSVDAFWHVPHYEKMLYDQAQLLEAYVEGFQNTGLTHFADIARSTVDYVLRDLTHPEGGFFSAEDADSLATAESESKTEGAFYVWKASEIDEILGKNEGSVFRYAYGARKDGNARAESDPNGELRGLNTLFRAFSMKKTAEFFQLPIEKVQEILEEGRAKLLEVRNQRPRPHLDDKIITGWNALMISGLCKAYRALGDETYLAAATRAVEFLYGNLSSDGKNLKRSWRGDVAKVDAFPGDYTPLIQALLDLYEANFEVRWLKWAVQLQEELDAKFEDQEFGAYFSVTRANPDCILQIKEDFDNAEPSPNSVASRNLLRLARIFGKEVYLQKAEAIFKVFGSNLERSPTSVAGLTMSVYDWQTGGQELVIAGDRKSEEFQAFVKAIHQRYLPSAVLIHADAGEGQEYLATTRLGMDQMKALGGKPTLYLCRNQTCSAPITDLQELHRTLDSLGGSVVASS